MSFGDELRQAGAGAGDYDPDDGPYHVKVIDANARTSNAGDPLARVILEILTGPVAGEQFEHFMFMGNRVGKEIAHEALLTYGVDLDSVETVEDLDRALFDIIGTIADVTVSHKGGYRNTKVNGSRTGKSDVPAPSSDFSKPPPAQPAQQSFAAAAAGGTDDDDVPF